MRQSNLLRVVGSSVLFAIASLSAGSGAMAQEANCECVVPQAALPAAGPLGRLTDVSGTVVLTGSGGPQTAASGAPLRMGDQLSVGPQSSASFSIGTCSLSLVAQTEMTLQPVDGALCVAVSDASVQPTGGLASKAPLAIFGTLAAGAILGDVILDRRDDVPVSP